MSQVILKLEEKDEIETLALSTAHTEAMAEAEAVAVFATPEPTVLAFKATHDALQDGVDLISTRRAALESAINALPALLQAHQNSLRTRGSYVQIKSGGIASKISLSAFEMKSDAAPVGPLPAPLNVKAVMGKFPGSLRVSCKAVENAKSYIYEWRENIEGTTFGPSKVVTTCRTDLTGLTSGKYYAVRMAVVGSAGQSPWSDVAICMVP